MANHELYVVQGKTLDNIAGTMRAVLGVDKDAPIRFDEVANSDKTEQINADVETQANLIAQIKTALDGKASGGGDPYEVINSILDGTIIEFCSFSNVIGKQKAIGTLFNNCPNLTKWAMPNLTQGLSIAFRYHLLVNDRSLFRAKPRKQDICHSVQLWRATIRYGSSYLRRWRYFPSL